LDGCREELRDCLDGCRWELEECLASCRGRGCREECRAEYEACLEECRADFEACKEECSARETPLDGSEQQRALVGSPARLGAPSQDHALRGPQRRVGVRAHL
jgi:hypothetical protein